MTIKQRGKDKICSSEFYLEGVPYRFSFNGKRGQPLITSKAEAREQEAILKRQLRAGTFIHESPLQNFARFYNEVFMDYSRAHKSEKSQMFDEYYGGILIAEFGKLRLSQIAPRVIERFLVRLSKTKTQFGNFFSPVTVRMVYNRLNQTFNLAIRERVANDNPCRLVSHTVLKDFPSWQPRERWLGKYAADEEEKLFDELDPRLRPLCHLLLNTGLRPPNEVLKIEKVHVNLTVEPRLYRLGGRDHIIPPQALFVAHGKDGSTRMIPLNTTAQGILETLCGDVATGKWLFLNRDGKPQASIKKGFAAACERAGIENLRPYDLRHTFSTWLLDRNIHQYVISALMGHSQPMQGFGHESRITPGYAHVTWEAMQRAVESLQFPAPGASIFGSKSVKSQAKMAEEDAIAEARKAG